MPAIHRLVAIGLMLVAAGTASGQLGGVFRQITRDGRSHDDMYPAMSADGSTVVWVHRDPTNRFTLYAATGPKFQARKIATGQNLGPSTPAISADGSTVAYVDGQVFTVPAAGGTPRQITTFNLQLRNVQPWAGLSLSRDGRFVCFYSVDRTTGIGDVFVADTTTLSARNASNHTTVQQGECWISADGKTVVFTGKRGSNTMHVWAANADGSNMRQVSLLPSGGMTACPRVDERGVICAFEWAVSGGIDVWAARTNGTGLTNLSQNGAGYDRRPLPALDGDRVTWKSQQGVSAGGDIHMAFPEGAGLRRITSFGDMNPSVTNYSHALNGDGTRAIFATCANVNGGNPEGDWELFYWEDALTQGAYPAPGGTAVFTIQAPSHAGDVYVMRSAFGRMPGIRLPNVGIVPLRADPLFVLSGQATTVFRNYQGMIGPAGSATARLVVPNVAALTGVTFHTAFVAVGRRVSISNPVKTTIR